MRRGVGVSGLLNRSSAAAGFDRVASSLEQSQTTALSALITSFHSHLEHFASTHRSSINQNPTLRRHFSHLCQSLGVDPLRSKKTTLTQLLGVGEFYFDLAVQLAEASLVLRQINGGILPVEQVVKYLDNRRGSSALSPDDLALAMNKLNCLGNSLNLVYGTDGRSFLSSVPSEINSDSQTIIELLLDQAIVEFSFPSLCSLIHWSEDRIESVLEQLICTQLIWVEWKQNQPTDNEKAIPEDFLTFQQRDKISFWFSANAGNLNQ
jgi:ESCRT-II complex subunit VPS22